MTTSTTTPKPTPRKPSAGDAALRRHHISTHKTKKASVVPKRVKHGTAREPPKVKKEGEAGSEALEGKYYADKEGYSGMAVEPYRQGFFDSYTGIMLFAVAAFIGGILIFVFFLL